MIQQPMFITPGPLFGWETTPEAKAAPEATPARRRVADSDSRGQRGFEAFLREGQLPYVAVDESKKAIFADSNIASFHFLVYIADGPNHLVMIVAGHPTREQEETLQEWEKCFGKGFVGVFVRRNTGGPWMRRFLSGQSWSEYFLSEPQHKETNDDRGNQ